MKIIKIPGIALVLAAMLLMSIPVTSGLADVPPVLRILPAESLHPGDTFNVTINFAAPDNDFTSICLTDTVPAGWPVAVDTGWCNPPADTGYYIPGVNQVAYYWLDMFPAGTVFTASYRVTVPTGTSPGVYNFPGGNLFYLISGSGYNASITGNNQIAVINTYTLKTYTSGSGLINKTPYQATYHLGDVVQLTATASPGWTFHHWSDDLTGSTNPASITINGNKTATAHFAHNNYTLTLSTSGNGSVTKNPNQSTYHYGDVVQLTANASPGWTFSGWGGSLDGSANPASITINGNMNVTAGFAQSTYNLTVNVTGGGNVTRDINGPYHLNDVVQLTANSDPGWTFSGWGGDLSGLANPASITINGNMTVTASFTQSIYGLTINVAGSGNVTSDNNGPYHLNDVVQLTATADPGWTFSGWSGDLSGDVNPAIISIDGDKTITATFTQNTYTLTVNITGSGNVTNDINGPYHLNDVVQITANADPGWTFSGWGGDLSGDVNPANITIDGDKTITASFAQNTYTLTINLSGSGNVTSDINGPYHLNDVIQLTANADAGWTFSGWGGDLSGDVNPTAVTLDGDKTITATFTQNTYTLTVNIAGSGNVTSDINGPYHLNDVVQLTANADAGWTFSGWGGDMSGDINPVTITLDGDKTVTANFEQTPVSGGSPGAGGGAAGAGGSSPGLTPLSGYLDVEGNFLIDVTAYSGDNLVTLTFPEGTIFQDSNGQRGRYIYIKKVDAPSAPPDDTAFVCFSYDITPKGGTLSPYGFLTFYYSDADVPEGAAEENLVIVIWEDGKWTELEGCVIDPINNTITVPITHLGLFMVVAHTAAARFETSEMTIGPSEIYPGEDITISAIITNVGDLAGSCTVFLSINGATVQNAIIHLKGGESQAVSFTVTEETPGKYSVEVGGVPGEFTVKEIENEGTAAEVIIPTPPATTTIPGLSVDEQVIPTQPSELPESGDNPQNVPAVKNNGWFITIPIISVFVAGMMVLVYASIMKRKVKYIIY